MSGERWSGLLVLLILRVRRKIAWATGVVNIMSGERWSGLLVLLILRVRRKMVWATGVVNITCQEKDGLGYWCC